MSAGYDPIISLMVEVKNALLAGKTSLEVNFSRFRENVLAVLKTEALLDYRIFKEKETGEKLGKKIKIEVTPTVETRRRLVSFRAYSRPGRRLYSSVRKLRERLSKRNEGLVVSTSQGVLIIKEAVKRNLGGEVLFEV